MDFLYGVCYRLLQHRDDAEEGVAETLFRASRRFASFRGEAQLSTWLYRIATNVCLDILRRRRPSQPLENEEGAPALQLPSSSPSALHEVVQAEERAALRSLLDRLPSISRAVLIMRELQELPYERIAELLGCSLGTVKSRIHRAKALARQILEGDPELKSLLLRQTN
jgi:RNA polymerase sigma-70 factor (ECF subfamily)